MKTFGSNESKFAISKQTKDTLVQISGITNTYTNTCAAAQFKKVFV